MSDNSIKKLKNAGLTEEELKKVSHKSLTGSTVTKVSAQKILESFSGRTIGSTSARQILSSMSEKSSRNINRNVLRSKHSINVRKNDLMMDVDAVEATDSTAPLHQTEDSLVFQNEKYLYTIGSTIPNNGSKFNIVNTLSSVQQDLQEAQDDLNIISEKLLSNVDIKKFPGAASIFNSMEEMPLDSQFLDHMATSTADGLCSFMQESKDRPTTNQNESDHNVFNRISQIVSSREMPDKLTRKGEFISILFEQRFITQLEITGNLNETTARNAKQTAAKFAKWIEDILTEVEARKNNFGTSPHTKEEDDDNYMSAVSSHESIINEDVLSEEVEVVKVYEISENELVKNYGESINDNTKYKFFEFHSPDNKPVEVKHLIKDNSKTKVMIVRKKDTDTQWTTWVVEVGPNVTLESGSVSQNVANEDKVNKNKQLIDDNQLRGFGFNEDVKLAKNTSKEYAGKIPILKRQCVINESDLLVEYPIYNPSFFSLGFDQDRFFDSHNTFHLPSPPQTEPSASEEP